MTHLVACFMWIFELCMGTRVRTGLSEDDVGCHRVLVGTGLSGDEEKCRRVCPGTMVDVAGYRSGRVVQGRRWKRRLKRRQALGENSCYSSEQGLEFPEKGKCSVQYMRNLNYLAGELAFLLVMR